MNPQLDEPQMSSIPVEGSKYHRHRGILRAHGTVGKLVALFYIESGYTSWLHLCETAKVLKEIGHGDRIYYLLYDSPLRKLDMVVRALMRRARDSSMVEVQLSDLEDPELLLQEVKVPQEPHAAKVDHLDARWQFSQVGDQVVEIIYDVHLDPGGFAPRFFANRFTKGSVKGTLIKMREALTGQKLNLDDSSFLDNLPVFDQA